MMSLCCNFFGFVMEGKKEASTPPPSAVAFEVLIVVIEVGGCGHAF